MLPVQAAFSTPHKTDLLSMSYDCEVETERIIDMSQFSRNFGARASITIEFEDNRTSISAITISGYTQNGAHPVATMGHCGRLPPYQVAHGCRDAAHSDKDHQRRHVRPRRSR